MQYGLIPIHCGTPQSAQAQAYGCRVETENLEPGSHVLLDCPRLEGLRKELRSKVGDAFNSMSTLLGGPGEEGRGKIDSASRTRTVEAVLDFAEASQRFQSRAP